MFFKIVITHQLYTTRACTECSELQSKWTVNELISEFEKAPELEHCFKPLED